MTSTSASQQPSGSSAAALIYTTTVPLAKPPDPLNLEARSRRGDNWLHFKRAWQIYERAAGIKQEPGESVDQYCTALMRLSEHCGFLTLRDSLIRDRLILGVKNDRSRKK
ncbi:unnamed protein product, partial [Pocillopora meandrina]